MGYGDYTPPSSGRTKPLTKKQLEKARQAYAKAHAITTLVKDLESKDEDNAQDLLGNLNNL